MLLLRLDTRRFGAAEWDTEQGDWRAWAPRLSWYIGGIALALLIFALHPSPVTELSLSFVPDRPAAIFVGLFYGICGSLFAFGIAWVRGGRLRFPSTTDIRAACISSIGTAFYDEFLFRGVILGLLLGLGVADWVGGRRVGDPLRRRRPGLDHRARRARRGRGPRHRPRERTGRHVDVRHRRGDRRARDHALRAVPRARPPAAGDPAGHAHGRASCTSSRRAAARTTWATTMDGEGSVRSARPDDTWAPAPPEGLYVHVPFCVSICPYCDFVVYGGAAARGPRALVDELVEALHAELALRTTSDRGERAAGERLHRRRDPVTPRGRGGRRSP